MIGAISLALTTHQISAAPSDSNTSPPLGGWDRIATAVIGTIADQQLGQEAREYVTSLLQHESLSEMSSWSTELVESGNAALCHPRADMVGNYRSGYTNKSLPRPLTAVSDNLDVLLRGSSTMRDRSLALKAMAVAVAAMHSPAVFFTGDPETEVNWFGQSISLREIWHTTLPMHRLQRRSNDIAGVIARRTSAKYAFAPDDREGIPTADWANETAAIALGIFHLDRIRDANEDYVEQCERVIDDRLGAAGHRLASVITFVAAHAPPRCEHDPLKSLHDLASKGMKLRGTESVRTVVVTSLRDNAIVPALLLSAGKHATSEWLQRGHISTLWRRDRMIGGAPAAADLYNMAMVIDDTASEGASSPVLDPSCRPPQGLRGDCARAVFYISVVYRWPIPKDTEAALRVWNREDPVDELERSRARRVQELQGNENPFVNDPTLIDQVDDF